MVDSITHCATRLKHFYVFQMFSYFLVIFLQLIRRGISSFAFCHLKKFKDYSQVVLTAFIGTSQSITKFLPQYVSGS